MAANDPFRPGRFILLQIGQRLGDSSRASARHDCRQFPGMLLQLDQVAERVGAAQLAGVNQAHKQVPNLRAVQGPIEQSI